MPVVLTVDVEYADRPADDPLGTFEHIRRVVEAVAAPVTYFVQGRFARAHPALVAELLESGATLGLHGYTHVDYRRLSPAGVAAEIDEGLRALGIAAPGYPVRYARLPHGYGGDDPAITAPLADAGLLSVGWDLSTFDWDDTLPLEECAARALRARDAGGVVLFHSWPSRTPEVITRLLAATRRQLVGLDEVELLGSSPNGRILLEVFADPPRT